MSVRCSIFHQYQTVVCILGDFFIAFHGLFCDFCSCRCDHLEPDLVWASMVHGLRTPCCQLTREGDGDKVSLSTWHEPNPSPVAHIHTQTKRTILFFFLPRQKIRQQAEMKDTSWQESENLASTWFSWHQWNSCSVKSAVQCSAPPPPCFTHHYQSVCQCLQMYVCVCVSVCAFLHCPIHFQNHVKMHVHQ